MFYEKELKEKKSSQPVKKNKSTDIPGSVKQSFSFNDERVHYNLDESSQLKVTACTREHQIYDVPGQVKYLKKEAGLLETKTSQMLSIKSPRLDSLCAYNISTCSPESKIIQAKWIDAGDVSFKKWDSVIDGVQWYASQESMWYDIVSEENICLGNKDEYSQLQGLKNARTWDEWNRMSIFPDIVWLRENIGDEEYKSREIITYLQVNDQYIPVETNMSKLISLAGIEDLLDAIIALKSRNYEAWNMLRAVLILDYNSDQILEKIEVVKDTNKRAILLEKLTKITGSIQIIPSDEPEAYFEVPSLVKEIFKSGLKGIQDLIKYNIPLEAIAETVLAHDKSYYKTQEQYIKDLKEFYESINSLPEVLSKIRIDMEERISAAKDTDQMEIESGIEESQRKNNCYDRWSDIIYNIIASLKQNLGFELNSLFYRKVIPFIMSVFNEIPAEIIEDVFSVYL